MPISDKRRWGGLAVLSLALAIIIVDTTLINVSLRTIVDELGTTVQTLQWVITGYALVVSAFTITGGRLGDIFGRKRMFLLGAIIFAAGSLTAALSQSATQLVIGASIIEGVGAALMMPATASLLLGSFEGRERAIAFGVWGGVAGASASLGPLLGGFLTTNFSWRWGYAINLVIVTILLMLSWLIIDSRDNVTKPKVDFLGIVLSSLGLASIVYGIVQSSTDGWIKAKQPANFFGHPINLGDYSFVIFALIFGAFLLIIFAMWQIIQELRKKTPLVSPRLFNHGFTAGVLTLAIVAMGQFGMFFTLPVFLQTVQGLDAFQTGLALLPFTLPVLIAAPLSGFLGTKLIGAKRVVIVGLVIQVIGLVYLHQLITPDATAWDIAPALAINGFGFGVAFAQLANITLSSVSVQQAGEASGVNNTFRQLGATLGTALLGAVLLGALQTNMTEGIANSTQIPQAAKPKLEAGVHDAVQSLGQETDSAGGQQMPTALKDEITEIQHDATAEGVRETLTYAAAIVGVGLLLSFLLPKGGGGHGVEAKPKAAVRKKPAGEPVQL